MITVLVFADFVMSAVAASVLSNPAHDETELVNGCDAVE